MGVCDVVRLIKPGAGLVVSDWSKLLFIEFEVLKNCSEIVLFGARGI